eukprot:TRINITY_DN49566_c0_g1_i1.p2 TRINITY_DN49566_c0_g1~~TRINITY_DN49566_c0_g1_i1.p2  ORF type:complete len:123 (+),score=19.24 TRINITY_DN49566_c0_g1_i1:174-542(+)
MSTARNGGGSGNMPRQRGNNSPISVDSSRYHTSQRSRSNAGDTGSERSMDRLPRGRSIKPANVRSDTSFVPSPRPSPTYSPMARSPDASDAGGECAAGSGGASSGQVQRSDTITDTQIREAV